MSGASVPQMMLEPIAADAASGASPGDKTSPMPDAPPGGNAASIQQGFPAITMESELSGGKPPLGQDMNGFLYLLSSHLFALQAGQGYEYSSAVAGATAMGGGYAVGAILEMADGTGQWLNTVDSNTSNPDTGGTGWVPLTSFGITAISSTGGTVTLSAAQARYPIILVTGALTSNLRVVFPNRLGEWRVVNSTSGAFTLTAASSGSAAVAIPQGGPSSPVSVYCLGDGNGVYPVVAPLSVAIDQNPTPLTLAERTNAGYLLATYFNQNSGLENPAIGAVFVEDSAHDGYLRKIPLANFLLQIFGSVSAGSPGHIVLGTIVLQWGGPTTGGTTIVFDGSLPGTIPMTLIAPFPSAEGGGPVQAYLVSGSITSNSFKVNTTGGPFYWFAIGHT